MRRKIVAVAIAILLLLFLTSLQVVEVADGNPTWGKPATPMPPIKDPPQIIINSPSPTVYSDPVPLNITIIQPDTWVAEHSWLLPNSYMDNSDSSNSVVVGQNTLRSITCIIDGQSFILWKGTPIGSNAVTYYLPRVTQFSAIMNLSKGQHNLQVNVLAVSDYIVEGIIPFAQREYNISANQSTTFRVEDGSDAPTIDNIKSSYLIWQSSSDSMPSSTIAPPQSLNPTPFALPFPFEPSQTASPYAPNLSQSSIPTSTPAVPESTAVDTIAVPIAAVVNEFAITAVVVSAIVLVSLLLYRRHRKTTNLDK